MNAFEGDTCYPDLLSLPEKVDAVIINVPPAQTEKVVREVKQVGINKVWLQQGSQSDEAVRFCKENGIDCVSNECILMFAQPSAFMHRAHKWVWGVFGKLPA
ncbi:MAG: CoA-binding protein [Ignavibacteria bacterium RBG_16_36_9]|nr:MAG: CoA-binding protein [Ignavibacteria bacterium RBG_16_36_9]